MGYACTPIRADSICNLLLRPSQDCLSIWLGFAWHTELTRFGRRFGINLFTRIPLSAGTTFVGAMVYGVRKYDLVNGGRIYPPYAMYADWGNLPGFTMVPSLQQVRLWLELSLHIRQLCSSVPRPSLAVFVSTWCRSVCAAMCMRQGQRSDAAGHALSCASLCWVQNGGNQPDNGTMFIVSSDLFTFSGLDDYEDGIPSLRTWAITHTERIAQVSLLSAASSFGLAQTHAEPA